MRASIAEPPKAGPIRQSHLCSKDGWTFSCPQNCSHADRERLFCSSQTERHIPTMRAAFFPFLLIALHVSVPADCRSRFKGLEGLRQNGARRSGAHADRRGSTREPFLGDFLVLLPARTTKSDFVSVFDLKRQAFVCLDSKLELYNSRQKDTKDCLFRRSGFISGVFYSSLASSHPSLVFLKRFIAPLVTRQRRSEEVNPSDPLRSESDPSHSVQDHKESEHLQPEQDQAGAVSKETISSCDDPLKVLHANGPVSPVKTIIADRAEQDSMNVDS
uniref:uncharacterized protein LOC131138363 n=1 Tax=Doryrhamphus excisus TaxID=161450 RepID=UPI0025AE5B0E|nr:uncharacterized protein LOC131138363 [Doryrhamphus excisus]